MPSILERQLSAFREKHVIDEDAGRRRQAPSLLYSPEDVKHIESDTFVALAQRGIRAVSELDPDIAAFARLFDGPPKERDILTREENASLGKDIRHLLLLLSPHFPVRSAQEVMEGLLHRYHVHRWNVDDVLCFWLPYHDSPLFTRLIQGLQLTGQPRWSWLQKLKEKPATLVRSAIAKYCCKDMALLQRLGDVVEETAKLHKTNRALATFFAAVWVDTLTTVGKVTASLVDTALPTLLFLLGKPHLRDSFQAALVVASSIILSAQLEESVLSALAVRATKGMKTHGVAVMSFLALVFQVQTVDTFPSNVLPSLKKVGDQPGNLWNALPGTVDCSNFVALFTESTLSSPEEHFSMVTGLISLSEVVDQYAEQIALALLQAFYTLCLTGAGGNGSDTKRQKFANLLKEPLATLGAQQPVALSRALKRSVDFALERGVDAESFSEFMVSAGAVTSETSLVPVIVAFSHKSAEVRLKAVQKTASELSACCDEVDLPRQRTLIGLAMALAEDESVEVASEALRLELWSLPETEATMSLPLLTSLLKRMLNRGSARDTMFEDAFHNIVEEKRAQILVPLVLNCFATVLGRDDCTEDLRQQTSTVLLPVLVLCIVGLELFTATSQRPLDAKVLQNLRKAVIKVCKSSLHPLFSALGKPTAETPLCSVVAQGANVELVMGLCNLLESRSWCAAPGTTQDLLGGVAAQVSAAVLLTKALPDLLSHVTTEDAEKVVARCGDACQHFAMLQTHVPSNAWDGAAQLQDLAQVIIDGAEVTSAGDAGTGSGRRRRPKNTGSSGVVREPIRGAVVNVVRLAFDRPRAYSAVLSRALRPNTTMKPVIFRIALGSILQGGASTANALWALASLLRTENASDWVAEPSLVVPLVVQASRAESPQVRAAVRAVLSVLHEGDWEELDLKWDSPGAESLLDAGVLRATKNVMTSEGWASLTKRGCSGLSVSIKGFLGNLVRGNEIEQDQAAASLALSKFLSSKRSSGNEWHSVCSFWATGLAMLAQPVVLDSSSLLGAIPLGGLLESLREPLRLSAEEVSAGLRAGNTVVAPEALRVTALKLAAAFRGEEVAEGLSDRDSVMASAVDVFVKETALPFLDALGDALEGEEREKVMSKSMDELMGLLAEGVSHAVRCCPLAEWRASVVGSLFKLCAVILSRPLGGDKENVLPMGCKSVDAAFLALPVTATHLQQLVASPVLRNSKRGMLGVARAAIERLHQHLANFVDEDGGLMLELGKFAKECVSKGEVDLLLPVLEALAAMGERACDASLKAKEPPTFVGDVSALVRETCQALGDQITSQQLQAALRVCIALAPLAQTSDSDPRGLPVTLATGIDALKCVRQPLKADSLSLLRSGLRRLTRCWGQEQMSELQQDTQVQTHLRFVLFELMVGSTRLFEEVDTEFCMSVARGAGVGTSLDYMMFLYMVRCARSAKPKKSKRKRRSIEGEAYLDEEILQQIVDEGHDTATDDVLGLLLSVEARSRLHCMANFAQTMTCLTAQLCESKTSVRSSFDWLMRPSLLPDAERFVREVGVDTCYRVLDIGLTVLQRFIGEHGLPANLDDEEIDPRELRVTVHHQDADSGKVALSTCYIAVATCVTETLLQNTQESSPGLGGCKELAEATRALVLRSLAVNHPVTFLRTLCLMLRIDGMSPTSVKSGKAVDALACRLMVAASDTLAEREGVVAEKDSGDLSAEELTTCRPLFTALLRHVCRVLEGPAEELYVMAWRLVDSLCSFLATSAPRLVVEVCFPVAASHLNAGKISTQPNSLRAAVASCLFIQARVEQLGRAVLEGLNAVTPPLLQVVGVHGRSADTHIESDVTALDHISLQTLCCLVRTVGAFMSPFLEDMLVAVCDASVTARSQMQEDLGREMVRGIPNRLLLRALRSRVGTVASHLSKLGAGFTVNTLSADMLQLQRLAALLSWLFSLAPVDVASDAVSSVEMILQLFGGSGSAIGVFLSAGGQAEHVSSRLLRRGAIGTQVSWKDSNEASALQLHALGASALAQLALRLNLDDLKPRFIEVVSWSRSQQRTAFLAQSTRQSRQEVEPETEVQGEHDALDASCATRMMALAAFMQSLTTEAPEIFVELILPQVMKDVVTCLVAARRQAMQMASQLARVTRKRRKCGDGKLGTVKQRNEVLQGHTWWWLEVSEPVLTFMGHGLQHASEGVSDESGMEEAVGAFTDPFAAMLDVFEFLRGGDDSPVTLRHFDAVQVALVGLCSVADGQQLKGIITAVLSKTRSQDSHVRLCASKICHAAWKQLGLQLMGCLSEVLMFVVELLEDEDQFVEAEVRAMIKTIELCTGESLQDQLKH